MLTSSENELFPGKKPTKPNWLYLKEEHTPKESDVAGWIQGWTQVYQLLETLKLHMRIKRSEELFKPTYTTHSPNPKGGMGDDFYLEDFGHGNKDL